MNTVTLLMLLPLSVLTLKTSWCKNYFLLFLKLIECFFNSCSHTVVSLSAFITEHKSLLRCSLICPFLKIPTYLSGRQCKSCLFLKAHRYSFFFFFLQLRPLMVWLVVAELWPEGICYSTTSVPVTLFLPACRGTRRLSQGWPFVCPIVNSIIVCWSLFP